jgi:hypothetical protein
VLFCRVEIVINFVINIQLLIVVVSILITLMCVGL